MRGESQWMAMAADGRPVPGRNAAAREAPRPKQDPFAQFCQSHGIYTPKSRACPMCKKEGVWDIRSRSWTTKNGEVIRQEWVEDTRPPPKRLVIAGRGA